MGFKCCVVGCNSGYDSEKSKKISSFHFPFEKPDIFSAWMRFVNRANWMPTKYSVICIKHFDEKYIQSGKRNTLKWKMNPVPTVLTRVQQSLPSTLPSKVSSTRIPPRDRSTQPDQLKDFLLFDTIKHYHELDASLSPPGYTFHKAGDNYVLYYELCFDNFPIIKNAIKIDNKMKVELQHKGIPVPLPSWFTANSTALLKRKSMLLNFPSYLDNLDVNYVEAEQDILEELHNLKYYKSVGHSFFSGKVIRCCLLLRSISSQAYKALLKMLPLPSMSCLQSKTKGNIDFSKAIKLLKTHGEISDDVIVMVDEMYLQKSVQYHSGVYYGADEYGSLYKGVVVIMVKGLKKSVPLVLEILPETEIKGEWLAEKLTDCISKLSCLGFDVRAIVSDNHSTNVRAFNILSSQFGADSELYINHPDCKTKIYLFFDNVHLVKNIRNNLLKAKKFSFPSFTLQCGELKLFSSAGYIAWHDLHLIHERDNELAGNLRMAPKLTNTALHPGNNKQNVNLALAIFHETTQAACLKYLPQRVGAHAFLQLIHVWWTIVNSKQRYSPNSLGNAVTRDDGKVDFLKDFADWLTNWKSHAPSKFCFTKQTFDALRRTMTAQSELVQDLLSEGYDYVMMGRFQTDPLERRFSQYRQMSGGRFLVSLREVLSAEEIVMCRSLLKSGVEFWKEDVKIDNAAAFQEFQNDVDIFAYDFSESSISDETKEVAYFVAGFIAKRIASLMMCFGCSLSLLSDGGEDEEEFPEYFRHLNRGKLSMPTLQVAPCVFDVFAALDSSSKLISQHSSVPARRAALHLLEVVLGTSRIGCAIHREKCTAVAYKKLVNIFYNNKQKLTNASLREDSLKQFKQRQREKN